jgi:hypothetical protein
MAILVQKYNPLKWYWAVGGSTTQVWSSQSMSYLPTSDTGFTAWAVNNKATPIANAGALVQVMYTQVEPYILSLGAVVTSVATPSINATYSLTPDAFSKLNTILGLLSNSKPLPGGNTTFSFPDVTGNLHSFTQTNIVNLAAGLQNWRYQWETAVSTLISGGSATLPGAITLA